MKKYKELQKLDINMQSFRKNGAYKRVSDTLTDADLGVLLTLKFADDDVDTKLSDVAKVLGLTLPAITHKVNDLEKRGLVIKTKPKEDARVIHLTLTLAASVHLDELVDTYYSPLIKLTDHLGREDTKTLLRILIKANSLGKII